LNPIIGWRWEFLITAALTAAVLAYAVRLRRFLDGEIVAHPLRTYPQITDKVSG